MLERLGPEVRDRVSTHGLRNGLLTSIAPTGTISLLAGNVSSGIEPVFDMSYTRSILTENGERRQEHVEDYAYALFKQLKGNNAALPDTFVRAVDLSPDEHLRMQAALQPYVDSAISKTVNCHECMSFEDFRSVYAHAYRLGLKGCSTYRPNPITGSVLSSDHSRSAERNVMGAAIQHGGDGVHMSESAGLQSSLPLNAPRAPAKDSTDTSSETRHGDATGDVVYMAEPLRREPVLAGYTYKLKWPDSDHAMYITINDILQEGRRRPFEIFINSKNLEHYAWTVALTRMISAVFRRGGDVSFVVEELKAVFDPRGGQWMQGRYVPSILAGIGEIIERHMIDIGFMQSDTLSVGETDDTGTGGTAHLTGGGHLLGYKYCPKCSAPALVFSRRLPHVPQLRILKMQLMRRTCPRWNTPYWLDTLKRLKKS